MDFDSILGEIDKERQKALNARRDANSNNNNKTISHKEETEDENDAEESKDEESEDDEKHKGNEEQEKSDEDSEKTEEDDEHDESEEKKDEDEPTDEEKEDKRDGNQKDVELTEASTSILSRINERIKQDSDEEHEDNEEEPEKKQQVEELKTVKQEKTMQSTNVTIEKVKTIDLKKDIQPTKKEVIPMPNAKTEHTVKTTIIKEIVKKTPSVKIKKAKKITLKTPKRSKHKKKLIIRHVNVVNKSTKKILKSHSLKIKGLAKSSQIKNLKKEVSAAKKRIKEAAKKPKELRVLGKDITRLKKSIKGISKKELTFAKKESAEQQKKIINEEIQKIRSDIVKLKEFQPQTLLDSVHRLNENIVEMNSLFRLASELMQKPDPLQQKLKKLFDENEKIAQGILTVLDAVNEIKEGRGKEVEELSKIENEIRLPLRDIANRKQDDYGDAPEIPLPPPDFREGAEEDSSSSQSEANLPPFTPPMMPMPSVDKAPEPTSIQAPNIIPPPGPGRMGPDIMRSGGPISREEMPDELPPMPTQFSADQLDQFAQQLPPRPAFGRQFMPQQRSAQPLPQRTRRKEELRA